MNRALLAALAALALSTPARAATIEIRHTPAQTVTKNTELLLKATLISAAGVYSPTVTYRVSAISKSWFAVPMIQMGDDPNVYGGAIPSIFVQGNIEYYIESYDTKLKQGSAGSKEKPFKVTATDPKPTRSTVSIHSQPEQVAIKVDGNAVGQTPIKDYELEAGTHSLTASKLGSREYEESFELPEGRDLDLRVVLQPKASEATFAVSSEPSGALLLLDGKPLGPTPYSGPAPSGEHILWLDKEGYLRQERVVKFSADRSVEVTFTLNKLPPQPALAVTTEPPGAIISVDGNDVGKTPFIGVIPPGDHELVLRKDGYKPVGNSFVMPDGRDLDLRFRLEVPPPTPTAPHVAVSSDPPEADVTMDGKPAGKTPLVSDLGPGDHVIKLSHAGFISYQRKIYMPKDRDIEVTLALIPEPPPPGPSKVTIDSTPPGLALTIDGKDVGKTPYAATLNAGDHKLGAKADGYRKTEQAITVSQGQSLAVKLALDKLPPDVSAPQLTIASDPPGARLLIDGKDAGPTPYSQPSSPGEHTLTVTLEGYKEHAEKFKLPSDKEFELKYAFTLTPIRKSVQLVSAAAPPAKVDAPAPPKKTPETPKADKALGDVKLPGGSGESRTVVEHAPPRHAPLWTLGVSALGLASIGVGGYYAYVAATTPIVVSYPGGGSNSFPPSGNPGLAGILCVAGGVVAVGTGAFWLLYDTK